jgi:hypothetical protein
MICIGESNAAGAKLRCIVLARASVNDPTLSRYRASGKAVGTELHAHDAQRAERAGASLAFLGSNVLETADFLKRIAAGVRPTAPTAAVQ